MPNFTGIPATIDRFLGFADITDPASLSLGLSSICKNSLFTIDDCVTRDGIVTTMQGQNAVPVTGLFEAEYSPESDTESFFRLHGIFDSAGGLQVEVPSGTGAMVPIATWASAVTVAPPAGAHMIAASAYNRGFQSFVKLTNLSGDRFGFVPAADVQVIDLETKRVDPYGLRPFGENWLPNEPYRVGEVVTPTAVGGNGHCYVCTQAGTSYGVEPSWPTLDSAGFQDGNCLFQEWTPVLANRLPIPDPPVAAVVAGGGFNAGTDVYLLFTSYNSKGETTGSAASKVTIAVDGSAIAVTTTVLPAWLKELTAEYALNGFGLYSCVVASGALPPSQSEFQYCGPYAPATTFDLQNPGGGGAPPSRNAARLTPGMLPTPIDAPPVQRLAAAGAFAAGRDVYVRITYTNAAGETPLGPSSSIINTLVSDAVQVTVNAKVGYDISQVGVYEADVATGLDEPPASAYSLVGYFPADAVAQIDTTASGQPAPTVNGTGISGNILADSPTGGINATQGRHYAAVMYQDFQGTISGFRTNAVISTVVDEDGWGLGAYHVPIGPSNVKQRIVAPTAANGTMDGPFFEIQPAAVSNGVAMTATVIPDNVTKQLQMDYTDAYLVGQTDLTYRLQTIKPHQCIDLYYAPSVDRFFQCGVPGFNGPWISRAADAASYQGDLGIVSMGADGQRTHCVREFRETVYALRERSGFTITPDTANPSAWVASRRWNKVGPCGPRAVDVGKEVMPFVHRSGLYLYKASGDPENVLAAYLSNRAGKFWRRINWNYGETVWCALDEENMVIYVGLPLDGATSPSVQMSVWFPEGWDGAPRISIDDIAANLGMRFERDLDSIEGDESYRTSQFVYASSGPDGSVQAIQPGRKDDNGMGIDWVYRTACPPEGLHLCKVQGYVLFAEGDGEINVALIAGKVMKNPNGDSKPGTVIQLRPIDFDSDTPTISRYTPSKLSEQWSMQFDNGKQPGAWCSLKQLEMYLTQFFAAR